MIFLSSLVIEAGLMNVPVLHGHRMGYRIEQSRISYINGLQCRNAQQPQAIAGQAVGSIGIDSRWIETLHQRQPGTTNGFECSCVTEGQMETQQG